MRLISHLHQGLAAVGHVQPGDVCAIEVNCLGVLRNPIVAEAS